MKYACPRCSEEWATEGPPHLCRDLRRSRREHVLTLIEAALAGYGLALVAGELARTIYDRLVRGGEEWDTKEGGQQ